MIAIELGSLVADDPIIQAGQHNRASTRPTRLEVGVYDVEWIVYLPGLALVVVAWRDTSVRIIPVEHVWTMNVRGGVDALALLDKAMV
jgi:hypothetical protein